MRVFLLTLVTLVMATMAIAQDGYRIRTGDTLRIEVLEDASLNRETLVLPDGRVSFPMAGAVRASGLTVTELARTIQSALADDFANPPNVYVAVTSIPERIRSSTVAEDPVIDIYLLGEVNAPGRKELEPGTTFLQALSEAGGFTNFAATKRLQLRRRDPHSGQEYVYPINYRALSRGAPLGGDPTLLDGDVILVPERGLFE